MFPPDSYGCTRDQTPPHFSLARNDGEMLGVWQGGEAERKGSGLAKAAKGWKSSLCWHLAWKYDTSLPKLINATLCVVDFACKCKKTRGDLVKCVNLFTAAPLRYSDMLRTSCKWLRCSPAQCCRAAALRREEPLGSPRPGCQAPELQKCCLHIFRRKSTATAAGAQKGCYLLQRREHYVCKGSVNQTMLLGQLMLKARSPPAAPSATAKKGQKMLCVFLNSFIPFDTAYMDKASNLEH